MNRIDRLTAILIHLQSKKVVKAKEIAERFGVSLRTVYRDIPALEEAGVPLGAEAGVGYFLAEGYHLPPVIFNQEEASVLLMAGKLFEKFSDPAMRSHHESALYKIRSVLDPTDKEYVEHQYGSSQALWKFTGEKWGWNLRVVRKKRTILYFTPQQKFFINGFVFGGKAILAAEASGLPSSIIETIHKAPKYAEGTGFRVEVRKKADVENIKELIDIKIAN